MANFYMILPSNVKEELKDYFPENTISHYVTKVPERIQLDGSWEVGLVEISYTYSWRNVPKDVKFILQLVDVVTNQLEQTEAVLPAGNYATVEELVKSLNETFKTFEISEGETPPSVAVEREKIVIKNGIDALGRLMFLKIPKDFAAMLSLDIKKQKANRKEAQKYLNAIQARQPVQPTENLKIHKASAPPDLDKGIHSLFLYCDIIKPTFVGNSYSQILRVVGIPSNLKLGQQVNIKYPTPFYMPLVANEFENIEILLKDDSGDDIPFEYGRVITTLHFRKKV